MFQQVTIVYPSLFGHFGLTDVGGVREVETIPIVFYHIVRTLFYGIQYYRYLG